ncbi:hypothetical protein [Acetivibrio clariflavus]|nr:hypothetical protein [Acetivibrio clariflavus]
MEEKKYYISFLPMFLFLSLVWEGIAAGITLFAGWNWEIFFGTSLIGLIIMALTTVIIFITNPIKINENGLIVKNQQSGALYNNWVLINWDDIYSVKPITLICFKYLQLFCKGHGRPVWIPLSVMKKSMFIEDLVRYVPDENPLKNYITTGKILDVTKLVKVEELANSEMSEKQISDIYVNEAFRAKHAMKNGAIWFYLIAGLSIINTIAIFTGADWRFLAGLFILQFVDILALVINEHTPEIANFTMFIAIAINVFVVGILIVIGYFANKQHKWSFIVGMIVYALDMLVAIVFRDFVSIIVHVVALIGIYNGLKAKIKLDEIEKKSMSIVP